MMSRIIDSRENDTSDGLLIIFLFSLLVISLLFFYDKHLLLVPVHAGYFLFIPPIALTLFGISFWYEGISNFLSRKLPPFSRISHRLVSLFSHFLMECHENMHTGRDIA